MITERYHKSQGGQLYYSFYFRFGQVKISISDIKAENEESAKKKAKQYLQEALGEAG